MGESGKQPCNKFREAISASARLLQCDEHQKALEFVDESLAQAIRENQPSWVRTLNPHAARISQFMGDLRLVKHYYQQSLEFVPENPMALYGLAKVAREQNEPDIARRYAIRCYKAITERGDEVARKGLLDLIVIHWPEVAE